MEIVGRVCAVGSTIRKLKAGDYVWCVCPHHFHIAIIVNESDYEIRSVQELNEDLLGQIRLVITSLQVASLLRISRCYTITISL